MALETQIKESCGETADMRAPIRKDKKSCLVKWYEKKKMQNAKMQAQKKHSRM